MTDHNRLLLELEKRRREINREIINPRIPELCLDDIQPILRLVAHARMTYLRELFDIAEMCEGLPSSEQVQRLREIRETFDELVAAANALETVVQRGYIDVRSGR